MIIDSTGEWGSGQHRQDMLGRRIIMITSSADHENCMQGNLASTSAYTKESPVQITRDDVLSIMKDNTPCI